LCKGFITTTINTATHNKLPSACCHQYVAAGARSRCAGVHDHWSRLTDSPGRRPKTFFVVLVIGIILDSQKTTLLTKTTSSQQWLFLLS
jgi:hypothetical protein